MEITLKTLTPILTGGVDIGDMDRLHETGIIGSLRWWYEAIVRGLGGYACDPSKGGCSINKKMFKQCLDSKPTQKALQEALDEQICPACQLFGCTGWSRKIKAVVDETRMEIIKAGKVVEGMEGEFILKLHEIKKITDDEKWLIHKLCFVVNKYGTIGAKCMIKPSDRAIGSDRGHVKVIWDKKDFSVSDKIDSKYIKDRFSNQKNLLRIENDPTWPDLRYFFFSPKEGLFDDNFKDLLDINSNFLKGYIGDKKTPARANKFASFKNKKKFWGYTKADKAMFESVKTKLSDLRMEKVEIGRNVLDEF